MTPSLTRVLDAARSLGSGTTEELAVACAERGICRLRGYEHPDHNAISAIVCKLVRLGALERTGPKRWRIPIPAAVAQGKEGRARKLASKQPTGVTPVDPRAVNAARGLGIAVEAGPYTRAFTRSEDALAYARRLPVAWVVRYVAGAVLATGRPVAGAERSPAEKAMQRS